MSSAAVCSHFPSEPGGRQLDTTKDLDLQHSIPPTCIDCGSRFLPRTLNEPFDLLARLREYGHASSLEESHIEQFLAETVTETARMDIELTRLRAVVGALEARRDKLEQKATRFRSLLAPIRKLPAELLSHIFMMNAKVNKIQHHPLKITWDIEWIHHLPGLAFGSVCRRWYEVSADTRVLWANINMYSGGSPSKLELLLSRSGQAPLNLAFHCDERGKMSTNLLSIAGQHCMRWQSIHIDFYGRPIDERSVSSLKGNLPILRSLSLKNDCSTHPKKLVHDLSAFEVAPQLRKVSFNQILPTKLKLPWNQITSFTGMRLPVSEVIAVIGCSPCLLHLTFDEPWIVAGGLPGPPTRSPSIVSFRCTGECTWGRQPGWNNHGLMQLLENLVLPSLSSASFTHITFPVDCFLDFMERSNCPLATLSLDDVNLPSETLTELFRPLVSLKCLFFNDFHYESPDPELTTNPDADELLQAMTAGHDGKDVILPRLSRLAFVCSFPGTLERFSPQLFIGMLESRANADELSNVAALERVSLVLTKKCPVNYVKEIQECSAQASENLPLTIRSNIG